MAMPVTVTVSSVGNSRAINCDWEHGVPVAVLVTGSSSGTFGYTIQTTVDDLQITAASAVNWLSDPNFTSATANTSNWIIYTAPIAGVRIGCSGLSSAVLTVKVAQGTGY